MLDKIEKCDKIMAWLGCKSADNVKIKIYSSRIDIKSADLKPNYVNILLHFSL